MLHVFITDLQAYNEGHLVGKWVELPISKFELAQALSEVLNEGEHISSSNNHEEWFITDYEWDLYSLFVVEEYADIYALNDALHGLDSKTDYELKAISFLFQEGLALDIEDAIMKAEDVIVHENQTMMDVAFDLVHDCYDLDSVAPLIANNIDYESIAKELEYDGTYWEVGADVYEYIG